MAFFEREEGSSYLYSGGTRIPTRTPCPKCGKTVSIDGFVSPYGNTTGLEAGGQEEWEWREATRRREIMDFLKTKYITITYVMLMLTIGLVLQLWL